jgi:Nickel responsive protein SCO4226-like
MKKFIIERKLPGAGNMTAEELKAISKTSVATIAVLGKPYKWVESFVTEDKIYCIHEAENEDDIREHGKCGDFPVNTIEEIKTVIGPGTAG